MSEEILGKCKVCNLDIVKHSYHDMDPYTYCSDFCYYRNDKEKVQFLSASIGDFIVYPCPDCGVVIEDEWTPDSVCSDCSEKRKNATQKEIISLQEEVIVDLISKLTFFDPKIQSKLIQPKLEKISNLKNKLK